MIQNTPNYSRASEAKKENFLSKTVEDNLKSLVKNIKRDDFFQMSRSNALKKINVDMLQQKGIH